MSNINMAKLLLKMLNINESFIQFIQDRKGHDFRYSVDYKKISSNCGYKPVKKFEISLEDTINCYKENELWWRPLKELV